MPTRTATKPRYRTRIGVEDSLVTMDVIGDRDGSHNGAKFEKLLLNFAKGYHLDVTPQVALRDLDYLSFTYTADLWIRKWHTDGIGADSILVSMKVQNCTGSAEEKVHSEIEMLRRILDKNLADRAYLVLDGMGWSRPRLKMIVEHARENEITVLTLDQMQNRIRADKH